MKNLNTQLVDQFINLFTLWASAQPDVLGLALVGSHARETATASSDIDLILITSDAEHYLKNKDWMAQFGEVEKYQLEYYGLVTSIRAWYANGLEVEYGITDERWAAIPLDAGTRQVIKDGMNILFERENFLSLLV